MQQNKIEVYQGIKISPNWDNVKSFQWMCDNARFVFSHKSSGGERCKLVVKEPVEGLDCFEIGNDRYGVIESACTRFSGGWGEMIDDSSKEVVKYIKDYLIRQGATDLVLNPSPMNNTTLEQHYREWLHKTKRSGSVLTSHSLREWHVELESFILSKEKGAAEIIEALVQLKDWKDNNGKDEHYLKYQPLVWEKAKQFLSQYNQQP